MTKQEEKYFLLPVTFLFQSGTGFRIRGFAEKAAHQGQVFPGEPHERYGPGEG